MDDIDSGTESTMHPAAATWLYESLHVVQYTFSGGWGNGHRYAKYEQAQLSRAVGWCLQLSYTT